MPLDPRQARAATTYGVSQAVIAGAGSGKTQTMKERVADAFRARDVDEVLENGAVLKAHERIVDHIGEVLAITFTDAAAAELKDRIKGVLRESQEQDIRDQALLVDDAWISTIHGMCSRLLRENAFTLGVDPQYSVVTDTQRDQLLYDAIDAAIAASPVGTELNLEYNAHGDYGKKVSDYIADIIGAAVKSPDQFDAFVLPSQGDPAEILQHLATALLNDPKADKQRMKDEGLVDNPSVAGLNTKGDAEALAEIERLLAQGSVEVDDALGVCRMLQFSGDLGDPEKTPDFRDWSGPWAQFGPFNRRTAISFCVLSLLIMHTNADLAAMVEIAKDAYARFQKEKRHRGLLDNDDLLLYAYRALQDERIAALYRDKFKLVIVDEFQDTNQLQLDIIRHFTGPDDCRLCVVGDRMQSIYRFQGADVSVCNGHLDSSAREIMSIDNNYRSHGNVILFVDTAFAGQGSEYLELTAARKEREKSERYLPFDERTEGPRVSVIELQHPSSHVNKARPLATRAIAARFKQMHEGEKGQPGRSYGEMVILLCTMTHADEYAQALREEGIPCAIVKGTVMKKAPEADMLFKVLNYLADSANTEALFAVLESELFELTDKDMVDLALSAPREKSDDAQEGRIYRDLAQRFDAYVALHERGKDASEVLDGLTERAAHAVRVLAEARSRLAKLPVHAVLNYVVTASGLLERLNSKEGSARAEGQAVGANLLKIVRLVREMEERGTTGANALAAELDTHIHKVGETPGALATGTGDFVRIMTIHASKGLSFPVVALSELGMFGHSSKLHMQASQGKTYLVLETGESFSKGKDCTKKSAEKLAAGLIDAQIGFGPADLLATVEAAASVQAPALFYAAVKAFGYAQEAAELERKIYVGMTRPEEALIVISFNGVYAGESNAPFEDGPLVQAAADAGLSASAAKDFINVNGFDGTLSGSLAQLHQRRSEIVDAGGGYQIVTPMWALAWERAGVLPPTLRGEDGIPSDLDGFDLRTIEPAEDSSSRNFAEASDQEASFAIYPDATLAAPWQFGYASNWASGVISASSIKAADHTYVAEEDAAASSIFAEEGELIEDAPPRVDSIARGLAFHSLAEWAVRHYEPSTGLVKPPQERIDAICLFNRLGPQDRSAVEHMLDAWFASDVAQDMVAKEHLVAEVPFFIDLGNTEGDPACLNGFIDLLAYDGDVSGSTAEVVDYKTGTSLTTSEARRAAYEVQAQVYAYALLQQGFSAVSLRFVFVEQGERTPGTQVEDSGAHPDERFADLPVEYFPEKGGAYTSTEKLRASLLARLDDMTLSS